MEESVEGEGEEEERSEEDGLLAEEVDKGGEGRLHGENGEG